MAADMKRADETGGACAKAIKDDGLALADDCRIDCIHFAIALREEDRIGYQPVGADEVRLLGPPGRQIEYTGPHEPRIWCKWIDDSKAAQQQPT